MQLKKILFSILVAIMMFSLVALAVSADTTSQTLDLVADIESATEYEGAVAIKPGEKFSYTIYVENNPGIVALEFKTSYNTDAIEFVECKNYYEGGTVFDIESRLFKLDGSTPGIVSFRAMQGAQDGKPQYNNYKRGTLITLVFKVKADYDGDISDLVTGDVIVLDAETNVPNVNINNVGVIKAHNYGDAVVSAPNCTESGKITYTCGCGDVWTLVDAANPAKGHTPAETWTVTTPATCTEPGTKVMLCSVCGVTIPGMTEEIPATNHSFGEWTVTTAPTADTKGVETRTCTNSGCTETETRDIEKLPKFTSIPTDPWTIGSEEAGLTFVTDAAYANFVSVKVNGTELSANCYTVSEGSTKVLLKAEYLDTLPEGNYEITVVSQNGSASAQFSVVPASTASAIIIICIVVAIVVVAVVAIVIVLRKKDIF